ncbi:hypothetical protein [Crenobacter luteus]|uniref:Uncharacterized protein n=1 Tax=Crenobacter luteus TaxID=1452487 RepID=A0A161SEV6_9NEIS|nr:hypothetical protein [Crenobacter luteus]KZE30315.1 hypothetical protein AVW16_12520 [Crenobacter luteus]
MGRSSWWLVVGMALAAGAFAGGEPRASSAAERYVAAKLDCNNMSRYQRELCLREAEDAYRRDSAQEVRR